ncbi:MAG: DUF523 and DUF1722 domain-containing protein [Pseudomonadota bacterium]|nr:MAG: DUF523 and DUF1722 domain-containing protein [Pseudomonadota bacterium]
MNHAADEKIRIGISQCLLGDRVRFDGNHKHDRYITDTLGQFFEFVPVCPEVAVGLGIPREPIRLEGDVHAPRAVGVRDRSIDPTASLLRYGRQTARDLHDISGYILKSKSPSCGMERVKVYHAGGGGSSSKGVGLFVAGFRERQPLLPMEEEGRLCDPVLRENFIERVFAYRRWQELVASRLTAAKLVQFHADHKLSLMAHGAAPLKALGQIVATAGKGPLGALAAAYHAGFMAAMTRRATRKRHTNVLQHMAGYLKKALDAGDRAELQTVIDEYRLGQVPLVVPLTLLKHHFRRFPDPYIARQVYLNPHPKELVLRNAL